MLLAAPPVVTYRLIVPWPIEASVNKTSISRQIAPSMPRQLSLREQ
jgi:hypothetical protein